MRLAEKSKRAFGLNRVSLVVLLVLACGGAESKDAESPEASVSETVTEAAPKASAKPSSPTAVQMIEKGAKKVPLVDTVAGPARYPEDGPQCPGCTSTGTWADDTGRIHRTWTSSSDGAALQKAMRDQLTKDGWSIQSALDQSGQLALDATKKQRRIAVLIASDNEKKGNLVSVIITP